MALPPELWDLISLRLSEIKIKEVAICRLLSKYFNEVILNNRILKFKFVLDGKDIRKNGNFAFRLACENGHVEIVKWIVKNFDFSVDDLRRYDRVALAEPCIRGYLNILQFFHSYFGLAKEDIRTAR